MYDQSCQVLPYESRKALNFELKSEFPEISKILSSKGLVSEPLLVKWSLLLP